MHAASHAPTSTPRFHSSCSRMQPRRSPPPLPPSFRTRSARAPSLSLRAALTRVTVISRPPSLVWASASRPSATGRTFRRAEALTRSPKNSSSAIASAGAATAKASRVWRTRLAVRVPRDGTRCSGGQAGGRQVRWNSAPLALPPCHPSYSHPHPHSALAHTRWRPEHSGLASLLPSAERQPGREALIAGTTVRLATHTAARSTFERGRTPRQEGQGCTAERTALCNTPRSAHLSESPSYG
eukprot:365930-Chlamydomonas_euryale.AAC.17